MYVKSGEESGGSAHQLLVIQLQFTKCRRKVVYLTFAKTVWSEVAECDDALVETISVCRIMKDLI